MAWWASERVRLPVLLGCLGVLVVYVLTARTGVLRASAVAECPSESAPHVIAATAADLSGLRASVARVMPQRIGRLYEDGTIEASNAWSDNSPSPPPLLSTAPRPAGYEMRWWAPNGDDIVADVFVFAGPRKAQEFLAHAASARCRPYGRQTPAPWPAQAHNLRWVNPDGFAQEDVLFARGPRVYRVADVPAGQGRAELRTASWRVDTLACLLPDAGCALSPYPPVGSVITVVTSGLTPSSASTSSSWGWSTAWR